MIHTKLFQKFKYTNTCDGTYGKLFLPKMGISSISHPKGYSNNLTLTLLH